MRPICLVLVSFLAACGTDEPADKAGGAVDDTGVDGGDDGGEDAELTELAVLGGASGDVSAVQMSVMLDQSDGLNLPRDLGFNPEVAGQLWVVNRTDDSMTIVHDAGTDAQSSENRIDPMANHFMEEPSSIAFGAPGTFATCQESRNTYDGQGSPNDFMGPTLWSSDLDVFAETNPEAVAYLTGVFGYRVDLGSHLDMLHEMPLCMGIAWDHDNVYWVFDGKHGAIVRADFADDHGAGFDDHDDGLIWRYVDGGVERSPDVPSHMELDQETRLLYFVDTGNNRVGVLDVETGEKDEKQRAAERANDYWTMKNEDTWTFIEGADHGLQAISGLALVDGVIFLTDNGTGLIHGFKVDGTPLGSLDTGRGADALMGLVAPSIDELWLVDAQADEVFRVTPAQ